MTTLATSHMFYTHGFETLLIIAILFTIIGYFVGRCAWFHSRAQADKIESLNTDLRKRLEDLKNN